MADGYDPPVPVNVALPACHMLAVDELPQGPGRLGAAKPCDRILAACLPALRRVDAVQTYPLACHLYRVAVDHLGRTGDVGQGEGRQQRQGGDQVEHGGSVAAARRPCHGGAVLCPLSGVLRV